MNTRQAHRMIVIPLLCASVISLGLAASRDGGKRSWAFESDEPGAIASGFTNAEGDWEVAMEGDNRVLYQKAKNGDSTFNVALVGGTSYKNVDLSVKLRAVAGEIDRGGGVIWRAKDKKNYYICRYNPLEDNFRVYKVADGIRTMFKGAKATGDEKWHFLRVTMVGPKITCYLDGQKLLEAEDATFPEAGMIGLWTKADAQSYFDDLTVNDSVQQP
jgi:3-keto-disaccharide hydrolase